MAVLAKDGADLQFEFPCANWEAMSAASQALWTVLENTCGIQTSVGNPYAATDFIFTLNGIVVADSPITITIEDGVYTIGISPATSSTPGSMSALDFQKAAAYLEPVSLNTAAVAIPIGAVTAITVTTPLLAKEYVIGDVLSVIDNSNGQRVKLTVTADTTGGATTISATGTSPALLPIGSILVPIFSARTYGTVTSVAATAPAAGFTISGSPITGSGTFGFTLANDLAAVEGIGTTGIAVRSAAETWLTRTLTAGTGISIADGDGVAGNPTITNTAPDQTVVLTEGAGIDITGTYPNFTIASTITQYTDENAQDAVGGILVDSTTVDFTYNDAGNTITADVIRQMSITADASGLKLSGDAASPGNTMLYGTDGVGAKGWYAQSGGYTDEQAQDAVGNILTDSVRIDFTYNDATPLITADLVLNSVADAYLSVRGAASVMGRSAATGGNVADIVSTADGQVLRRSGATLGWGTVATIGIADDAVTYAKMQDVSATTRWLGRITAGAGNVEELTLANMYTMLGLTGVANRFALWTGVNTLSSDAAFTFDAANDRMTITGTVAGTGANSAFLNLNSGAITGATEFLRMSGNITGNMIATMDNSNNLANSNTIFTLRVGGSVAADPTIQFAVAGVVTHAIGLDNSDSDKFKITPNSSTPGGTANSGLIITNAVAALVGINKDAPAFPMDVAGKNRADQFLETSVAWGAGDVNFGSGAGTGPALNSIHGTHNRVRIVFTTGTAPAANNNVFVLTMKAGFEFANRLYPVFLASDRDSANATFWSDLNTGQNFGCVVEGTLTASTQYALYVCWGGY